MNVATIPTAHDRGAAGASGPAGPYTEQMDIRGSAGESTAQPSLEQLVAEHDRVLMVAGRAETTRHDRRRTIRAWAQWLGRPVLDVHQHDVLTWLSEPRWSAQTRRTYLGHVRGFYQWAMRAGLLDFDPTSDVGPIRVPMHLPKPFSDDQIAMALTRLQQPIRSWFVLAAYAGLRCCEIAGLRGQDVDHDAGTLFIRAGKGSTQAMLPMHDVVMTELREMPRGGPLWRGADGRPITAKQVSASGYWALQRAGVGGSMHRARHYFGTTIYRSSGGNLRVTQELLRHRSPSTTALYTLITVDEKRAALAGLPLFG